MDANRQQRSRRHFSWMVVCGSWIALLLSASSSGLLAQAGSPKDGAVKPAEQLMRETIDAVFAILRDPELKKDAKLRLQKLRLAVDKAFGWEAMAQSSLGPPWRKLDAKQQREFVAIFKELLAQQYMDDIDRFQGSEQIQIVSVEKSGGLEIVNTLLITSSREKIPMNYSLQQSAKGFRVIDLAIEGVSLVNHYRDTFSRFLTNKSFAELMQQLKRKLGTPAAPPP